MAAYNPLMTSRPQRRLATTGEVICAALMTVVGHALVLIALTHRINSNRVTAEQDQESALEVTFITVPKISLPDVLSVQPAVHRTAKASAMLDPLLQPARQEQVADQASEKNVGQQAQVKDGQNPSLHDSLRDRYEAAIRSAIERKWQSLSQSRLKKNCTLHFTQASGGVVTSALARNCDLPEEDRVRLEAAVLMAQPLPYQGYESVFIKEFDMKF